LERLFIEEGERIVFWNDPDREFLTTVPFITIDGVTLPFDEVGSLDAKIRLEREKPKEKRTQGGARRLACLRLVSAPLSGLSGERH